MDVAAKVLAGEPVAEFVNRAQQEKQQPEGPDVVGALVGKRIERRRVVLNSRPIPRDKIHSGNEKKQREQIRTER